MAALKGAGGGIPAQVLASKALKRREVYAGLLPVKQMPRLAALVAEQVGELSAELEADRDGEGAGWLRGKISGVLPLTCQRGLHSFDWVCEVPLSLRLVFSESEEEQLLKVCEPYLVRDDQLPLREVIEDEVLLSLPIVARCDDPECIRRL